LNRKRDQISLKSLNYPHNYVRHAGYKGYIHRCTSDLCRKDASWSVKTGFIRESSYCEKTVSFQSDNYPKYYLRHQNSRVRISRSESHDLYRKDSSWVYHLVSCHQNFRYITPTGTLQTPEVYRKTRNRCIRGNPSGLLKLHSCYRFEAVNFDNHFMRHSSYQLWKQPGRGSLYLKDSTFKVVPALNRKRDQISLQSLNYPQNYVRHSGYKGYIHRCTSNLCRNDASWTVKIGFIPKSRHREQTVSFQSANYREHYLRHQNSRIRISRRQNQDLFRKDASWVFHKVSCR